MSSPYRRTAIGSLPQQTPIKSTRLRSELLPWMAAKLLPCALIMRLPWDTAGKLVYVYISQLHEGSYAPPVPRDWGLPKVSPGDIARIEPGANTKTIAAIPQVVHS
jgi:hypothetical protein